MRSEATMRIWSPAAYISRTFPEARRGRSARADTTRRLAAGQAAKRAAEAALCGAVGTLLDAGGGEEAPLYAMLLEVAVPGDPDPEELAGALAAVAAAERVEVSVRRLESDAL